MKFDSYSIIKTTKAILGENITRRLYGLYIEVIRGGRLIRFDQFSSNSEDENLAREARKRWVQAKPDLHLTWRKQISGDAFIKQVLRYTTIQPGKNILEIGPGWGRLLKSILDQDLLFDNYYGVDISGENIDHLKRTFQAANIHFIQGNAEDLKLHTTFDIILSSLTFKHVYPSFEKLLTNVSQYLNKNGMVFFDVIEDDLAFFDKDGTFIRCYTKPQIKDIIQRSNLDLVDFDTVIHAPGYSRLLVVAKNS
jgi:2-polyprenyl-3-methyl-5-hydroxy-6-metoxy-1,4-benzoquinol methylase